MDDLGRATHHDYGTWDWYLRKSGRWMDAESRLKRNVCRPALPAFSLASIFVADSEPPSSDLILPQFHLLGDAF